MADTSSRNRGLPDDGIGRDKASSSADNQQIVRWSTRLKLPDSAFRKSRRRKETEAQATRVLTEEELRQEAAWKQVEETGRPVLLDGTLLVPEGMSIWKALEFFPDPIREPATRRLERVVANAYRVLLKGAEGQVREKAMEDGKLEQYDELPGYAKSALAESIVRQQLNMPEVPLEDILDRWQAGSQPHLPDNAKKAKSGRKKSKETARPIVSSGTDVGKAEAEQEATVAQKDPNRESQVLRWNIEHHGLLLKRLGQVRAYLTDEEREAIDKLLRKKLHKAQIDQIDEIIRGCDWVRRLDQR